LFRFVTSVEGLRFHIWSGTPVNVQANLKKGPTGCPVTWVIIYQPAVRNIPEELIPQLTNQQTKQPTNKPTNQPTNKPTNQPTNQPTNKPTTNKPTNQQTNKPTNKPTNSQQTKQQTNQLTNKPTNQPTKQPGVLCKVYIKGYIQSVTPGSHNGNYQILPFKFELGFAVINSRMVGKVSKWCLIF